MLERTRLMAAASNSTARIEAWGGAECTINRVGDRFRDQLAETGHGIRATDLVLINSLRLDAVRIPVLWETIRNADDWTLSDQMIASITETGARPILGLIHHGSGPSHTSLIDESFAQGLAHHAARVAQRYPHVTDWTPINEPLTTARFSALYGLWYPHLCDECSFWLALLNQIDATRLAMREIRNINPLAKLIQTEDLGRTYALASLRDQAAYDNQRRWMTWDLLCGWVGPDHPLWQRLVSFGFEERLSAIRQDPCPPGVIGINHYLTSDRMLDPRIDRYPVISRGGNATGPYCDVEAVRVLDPAPSGLVRAIDDAWTRYHLPIALTEVHNGCTREEQIRWLSEAWKTARLARKKGINVCAVTAWALFGSRGWDTLLTGDGSYEAGAFDVSSGTPRETALAKVIRKRGAATRGLPWWRRPIRLAYSPEPRPAPIAERRDSDDATTSPPLMILGKTGTLGRALADACQHRDIVCVLLGRGELDLLNSDSIDKALDRHRPWAVVNAAGWVRVDDAESDEDACRAANSLGPAILAQSCARSGVACLNFSTDLVFDGATEAPYDERASPNPLGAYGRSKSEMEERLAALPGRQLIIRTAAFFSPYDRYNFASYCAEAVAMKREVRAVSDWTISPTYVPDLCRAALDLLIDGETGIWHLTNGQPVTWHTFAQKLIDALQSGGGMLTAVNARDAGWRARRPAYSALGSSRGVLMPSLDSAIARFAASRRAL